MAFELDYSNSTLGSTLEKMKQKLPVAVLMYATTKASELQAKMKVNRPWTDRTGFAKTLLNGKASQASPTIIRITLSHGVDYGIWLELAHEKNYAIIAPTIQAEGQKVIQDVNDIMGQLVT